MPLLAGTEPTGVEVSWTFIHIWRVEDDRIVEHWACRDDLGLLHQIGAWPPRFASSRCGETQPGGSPVANPAG